METLFPVASLCFLLKKRAQLRSCPAFIKAVDTLDAMIGLSNSFRRNLRWAPRVANLQEPSAPFTLPGAYFKLGGGGNNTYDFVGAAVVGSMKLNGYFHFHYDESVKLCPQAPQTVTSPGW